MESNQLQEDFTALKIKFNELNAENSKLKEKIKRSKEVKILAYVTMYVLSPTKTAWAVKKGAAKQSRINRTSARLNI